MSHSTKPRPLYERLDDKTVRGERESQCWLWMGAKNPSGYGYIGGPHQSMLLVHRVSYERHVGPIGDGLHLDHLCRNRACLNPLHLQPVTATENTLRGVGPTAINARLTSCRRGHPFTEANTRVESNGSRRCLTCRAANRKARGW